MGTRRAWVGASTLALAAASAGTAHAQNHAPPDNANPFRQERWSEDWRDHHGPDAPFGAGLKDMEIAEGVTLSLGGDARWRAALLDAPKLGLAGEVRDVYLNQRLTLHADLRFGDSARAFLQLGVHDTIGRVFPGAADDDGLDIQQAFVDFNTRFGDTRATVRLGRQELALGSPRFVTLRDAANVRQRHDIARLSVEHGRWRADLFGGRPTTEADGQFDDEGDPRQEFYGLRLGRSIGPVSADAFIYQLDREAVSLAGATANDNRRTYDIHIAGRMFGFDVDFEAMNQTGDFGADEIVAHGYVLDVSRVVADTALSPRLGGRITFGSGDSDIADGEQETFAPPFPHASWFGQNGLASFSNTTEAAGTLSVNLLENFTFESKISRVWRSDANDFLYAGNNAIPGTDGGSDTFAGTAINAVFLWRPSPNITVHQFTSYFQVGSDLHSRGADDVFYTHIAVAWRF